jgi:hypothetical protein
MVLTNVVSNKSQYFLALDRLVEILLGLKGTSKFQGAHLTGIPAF